MLARFSLYGFLKNQRYFESFLVLAFLDRGLDFLAIGLLVGWRDLLVSLLEIPSGAVADVFGRRRTLALSMVAYAVSFSVLGLGRDVPVLGVGMALYAVGDSLRTGTHKAMIFSWLRAQGRTDERTRVYGRTRSWSKLGSAVGVVVGAAVVLGSGSYDLLFGLALVPYVAGVVNLLGYPASLEGERVEGASPRAVARRLWASLRTAVGHPRVRELVAESMGMEGVIRATKDYLQPVLAAAAVAWLPAALLGGVDAPQRSALLVGPVYMGLFLLSGVASRYAHVPGERLGSDETAARALWVTALALFAALLLGLALERWGLAVGAFVALQVLQNLWRPALVGRLDAYVPPEQGATVLSVESQAKSAASVVLAPALGWAVDAARAHGDGGLWPVAALGVGVAGAFTVASVMRR